MPSGNVDIVRRMWEPFEGLDARAVDWDDQAVQDLLLPQFSPDVELTWSATWAGEREYRGRDGVIQAFKDWMEPFSEYHVEAQDFVEVGDHVAVPNRQWGIGRESGAPVEIEVTHVYEFRDGLIVRLDEYDTKEGALDAIASAQKSEAG
jgi:ketosteroid isomerase-like protein